MSERADDDFVDCPICGDRNARAILMMRSYAYVCPDPDCPNFCPDQYQRVNESYLKLFESDDELDFLAGDEIMIPPGLCD